MLLVYFIIGGDYGSANNYHATEAAISYTKSMLIPLPPGLLYVIGVIFLLPCIGLPGSLTVSIATYLGTAFLLLRLI